MIPVLMIVAVVLAAAYLLRPLLVMMLAVALLAGTAVNAAPAPPPQPTPTMATLTIGLLLLAVDVRRDHLRVSEALRLTNVGSRTPLTLRVALPASAQYVTFHRGWQRPAETSDGFVDRLLVPRGISELAYSYAIPAERRTVLRRSFPLPVQRLEIVVRGRGVRLAGRRGQALPPLDVGGELVARWEVRGLPAGEPVAIELDNVPTSQPARPVVAAGLLAAMLGAGVVIAMRRRPPAAPAQ